MKIIKGGLSAPLGFLAASASCGIKKSKREDLALLYSKVPAVCTGTFTMNQIRSGSVSLSEKRIKKGIAKAIVVNSGNANCCVGKSEISDAMKITTLLASKLNINKDLVLIASTGVIGKKLPLSKIKNKITRLVKDLDKKNAVNFSKAIMTTDTVPKEIAVKFKIKDRWIKIGAAAKGSGMICPHMATMLAFFTTDASIEKGALKSAFKEAVSDSFNKISVDGDTSTNDTAIIMANGLTNNRIIKKNSTGYFKFLNALKFTAQKLAKKIVLDGEGATRFVEILVKGAKDFKTADTIARHIADSNLIKTMIAGGDPNWGRVAASAGSSGIKLKGKRIDIYFGKKLVMKNGASKNIPKGSLKRVFSKKEILIIIDLKSGKVSARMWTCDLTKDYIRINSEYST